MQKLADKILAVFISLILVFSPLQGVMADLIVDSDKAHSHQDMSMHKGMVEHTDTSSDHSSATNCTQCDTQLNCANTDCSMTHCATCVLALNVSSNFGIHPVTSVGVSGLDAAIISQYSSSPFRPPRG